MGGLARGMAAMALLVITGNTALAADSGAALMAKDFPTSWDAYQAMRAVAKVTPMTFAKLPDWTGIWTRDMRTGFAFDPAQPRGGKPTAVLTPDYQAKFDLKMANLAKNIEWDPLSACLPAGYPRWLLEPFLREYVLRPEEAWLMTEQNEEIRRVYTANQGHVPDDVAYPTWEGDSVGFWDGDTLVIHTNNLKAGQYQRTQPDYSEQATTVERMRKIDPDTIEDVIVVYDPVALVKPWHSHQSYQRVKEPDIRINHWSCEENNNVIKTDAGSSATVLPGEKGYKDPDKLGATKSGDAK